MSGGLAMNGISMGSMPPGLLAKKGMARPAMRRQSQTGNRPFGEASLLSGWNTGSDDDLGWNDMGDGGASALDRSAIGLTPIDESSKHEYLHADDWDDECEEDERDSWTSVDHAARRSVSAKVQAGNAVGEMQQKIVAAAEAKTFSAEPAQPVRRAVAEQPEVAPAAGLFGHLSTFFAMIAALFVGRGGGVLPVLMPAAIRDRVRDIAAMRGVKEQNIVTEALQAYLADGAEETGAVSSATETD